MAFYDATHDQLEREIGALPKERRVVFGCRICGGEALKVFGYHQLRSRNARADALEGQLDCERLIYDRATERRVVAHIRIPVPVQRRKTSRRERLVDRRPTAHPGKCSHRRVRIGREQMRKIGVDETGMRRTAAVMQQRDDRFDAALAQPLQASVMPRLGELIAPLVLADARYRRFRRCPDLEIPAHDYRSTHFAWPRPLAERVVRLRSHSLAPLTMTP